MPAERKQLEYHLRPLGANKGHYKSIWGLLSGRESPIMIASKAEKSIGRYAAHRKLWQRKTVAQKRAS